jgi:hypothetical protein
MAQLHSNNERDHAAADDDDDDDDALSAVYDSMVRNPIYCDPRQATLNLCRVWEPLVTRQMGKVLLRDANISTIFIATDYDDSTQVPDDTDTTTLSNRVHRTVTTTSRVDSPLLRYFRTSTTLREVQLFFGAQMVQPRSMDTASLIYKALADNPRLPKIYVFLSSAYPLALFLGSTVSLQDLRMELDCFEEAGQGAQMFLARSLGGIRSLRTLHLDCKRAETMTELVLRHLCLHATLRYLRLNGPWHSHWYNSFHQLIVTSNTIQVLSLSNFSFAEDDMQSFVNTLLSSRSLTTLELFGCKLDVKASRLFATFVRTQCNNPSVMGQMLGIL